MTWGTRGTRFDTFHVRTSRTPPVQPERRRHLRRQSLGVLFALDVSKFNKRLCQAGASSPTHQYRYAPCFTPPKHLLLLHNGHENNQNRLKATSRLLVLPSSTWPRCIALTKMGVVAGSGGLLQSRRRLACAGTCSTAVVLADKSRRWIWMSSRGSGWTAALWPHPETHGALPPPDR